MKGVCLFITVLYTVLLPAQGSKNFIDQNFIEVTGKAEMKVVPDLIYLRILIRERDLKNKMTLAEGERLMIQRLDQLGIDTKKDLVVKDLASNYRQALFTKDVALSKEYILLVRDGKSAARVIIEMERIDLSNIRVQKIDHTRIKEFQREVKVKAITDGHEKAVALAKAINQAIGKALFAQELDFAVPLVRQDYNYDSYLYQKQYAAGAVHRGITQEPDVAEIDFEEMTLEYSILVRFELK